MKLLIWLGIISSVWCILSIVGIVGYRAIKRLFNAKCRVHKD